MSVFGDFLVLIFRIRTEYVDLLRKSLYSVRMWEYVDQKNFEYEHFLRSVS